MKIWGNTHLPLREFLKRVYQKYEDNTVSDTAAALSYYFVFSLFPFLFFLATLTAAARDFHPFTGGLGLCNGRRSVSIRQAALVRALAWCSGACSLDADPPDVPFTRQGARPCLPGKKGRGGQLGRKARTNRSAASARTARGHATLRR